MPSKIAYLAEGKLYLKFGEMAVRPIESPFAQNILDRNAQNRERNQWKGRGTPGNPFSGGMVWGGAARDNQMDALRPINITGITRGTQDGELIYALDTGQVGGLFSYDTHTDFESRLFHKNEFRAHDLARHPSQEIIALSLPADDGTADIALMQPGGKGLRRITEGDCRDEAPAWIPGDGMALVYQTSGIGRNRQGHPVAFGPYAIQKLDIDRDVLVTLLESPEKDYLVPRAGIDEALYFIRRPYKSQGHSHYTPMRLLSDIVMFPPRLLRAIFGFLNFFSVAFSGKPLTTAGGPREQHDTRHMMLWGKLIDAEKAMTAASKGKPAALVPASWELVRMDKDGKQEVLAKSVLSFDLCGDGTIVYTNGSEIFLLDKDRKAERICAHKMIEKVLAVA